MINSVRNLVLSVLNKNNFGYISPADFNLFAKQAQLELFEEYFSGYAAEIRKQNARRGTSGTTDEARRTMEVIDTFYTIVEDVDLDAIPEPNNLHTVVRIMRDGREAERIENSRAHLLTSSPLVTPTVSFPVYTQQGGVFNLLPTGTSTYQLHYIRIPLAPKWTYINVQDGSPIFNINNDYQDFELPLEDEPRLAMRILQYCGISIRETEVYAYANTEETQSDQKKQ